MDYRGTWVFNQKDPNKPFKSIEIVSVDEANGICYGPNNVRLSIDELISSYTKSDPFAAREGNQHQEIASAFKQYIVDDVEQKAFVDTTEIKPAVQVVKTSVAVERSPELDLLNALKAVSKSKSSMKFTSELTLPISLDVIKPLMINASDGLDKVKLISLMIELDKESIFERLAECVLSTIETGK